MLKRKARPMLSTLFAVLMVLVVAPRPALADTTKLPSISQFKGTITIYRESTYGSGYAAYRTSVKTTKSNPVTNIKSTNAQVAYADVSSFDTTYTLHIFGSKKGTSTISFKYKGKTYKAKVKVVNYKSPIKSFKIGGKNFTSKYKKQVWASAKVSTLAKLAKKQVKITPAKGWTVKSINVTNYGYTSKGKLLYKTKTIKNGAKLPELINKKKVNEPLYTIAVTLQNTKTKGTQTVTLWSEY